MASLPAQKEDAFPLLAAEGYDVKSPATFVYNCIAFAADNESHWWWPDASNLGFWPQGVPREVTLDAFVQAYTSIGYEVCLDGSYEAGFEKIVMYERNGAPTHAAKQTADGKWKSKLGRWEDIVHNTTRAVESAGAGGGYGLAKIFMRRPI